MNAESSFILTILNESNIATNIANKRPPMTGAGIQIRLKIETWLIVWNPI